MKLKRTQKYYFFALTGLLLTLITHLLTFAYINIDLYLPIWSLSLTFGSIVLIFLAIEWNAPEKKEKAIEEDNKFIPNWLFNIKVILIIYTVFNFLFCLVYLTEGGLHADVKNGKYVLTNHGWVKREITKEIYYDQLNYEARIMHGHCILFYYMIYVTFLSRLNEKDKKERWIILPSDL
jgi:hypothetical protein